jgi:hypothetical protein
MSTPDRVSAAVDSPWFWLCLFSGVALLAVAAIGPKYAKRQAGIERKFQMREHVAERRAAGDANPDDEVFTLPAETAATLWPIVILLVVVFVASAGMLLRRRRMTNDMAS